MKTIYQIIAFFLLVASNHIYSQVNENTIKSIGRIFLSPRDTVSIGTGFVAGKSKSIYTCSHVAISDTLWFKSFKSDIFYRIKLKYNLPNYDVAYLERTQGHHSESLNFGDFDKVQPGDKIIYVGWDAVKKAYSIVESIILAKGLALMDSDSKADFIEFGGEAIPGFSGGPVFDVKGNVIGIIREAWSKKGIKGGNSIQINRAFSTKLLKILDSEIKTGSLDNGKGISNSLIKEFVK